MPRPQRQRARGRIVRALPATVSSNPFWVARLRRSALPSSCPLIRVRYRQAQISMSSSTTSPLTPTTPCSLPGFCAHTGRECPPRAPLRSRGSGLSGTTKLIECANLDAFRKDFPNHSRRELSPYGMLARCEQQPPSQRWQVLPRGFKRLLPGSVVVCNKLIGWCTRASSKSHYLCRPLVGHCRHSTHRFSSPLGTIAA